MVRKNIKGYVFEYFVKQLLLGSGFQQVIPDGKIIYQSAPGTMIHGLGQPHNADVLVSPPIQIPFYFPTRLLIECKCYDEKLGIEFARNVLGLRQDLNNFDVVTPEILASRKNYRRKDAKVYKFDRCLYQVALASSSGFKYTTEEFATVHRIPLISFATSNVFSGVRSFLTKVEDIYDRQPDYAKKLFREMFVSGTPYDTLNNMSSEFEFSEDIINFLNEVNNIAKNMNIGVLENGTLLFLYKQRVKQNTETREQQYDGYKLYWADDKKSWKLEDQHYDYYFELPDSLLIDWDNEVKNWEDDYHTRMRTLNFKARYLPKIIMYEFNNGKTNIKIMEISKTFLKRSVKALKELNEE